MEVKIINETQNDLFKRKEVTLEVSSNIAPSNADVQKWLVDNYKTDSDTIKIKNILGKFGSQVFKVEANVYESFQDKDQTEVKTKRQREAEKKVIEDKIKADAEAKKVEAETKKAAEEEKKAAEEKPVEETLKEDKKEEAPTGEQDEPKGEVKPEQTEPEKEPEASEKQKEELSKPDEEPK